MIQWDINGIYPLVMTNSKNMGIEVTNHAVFFWES